MIPFTRYYKNFYSEKFPIVSKESGIEYKVRIKPYREEDKLYNQGSNVILYRKRGLFFKNVLERSFENNKEGKINITYFMQNDYCTSYKYDMVNMAKLIVEIYENRNVSEIKSLKKIQDDFKEFKDWNGVV